MGIDTSSSYHIPCLISYALPHTHPPEALQVCAAPPFWVLPRPSPRAPHPVPLTSRPSAAPRIGQGVLGVAAAYNVLQGSEMLLLLLLLLWHWNREAGAATYPGGSAKEFLSGWGQYLEVRTRRASRGVAVLRHERGAGRGRGGKCLRVMQRGLAVPWSDAEGEGWALPRSTAVGEAGV